MKRRGELNPDSAVGGWRVTATPRLNGAFAEIRTRDLRCTGAALLPLELRRHDLRCKYARRDSNPQKHGPQPCPSTSCGTSVRKPPPGADPGRPLYESGAAAVRGGVAAHRGFEPRLARPGRAVLPVERMGIACGRRDSNAHAARFGLARSSGCLHFRVRRQGFEPRTCGLRIRRSDR